MDDLSIGTFSYLSQKMREVAVEKSSQCVVILSELVEDSDAVYYSVVIAFFNYSSYRFGVKSIADKALDEF